MIRRKGFSSAVILGFLTMAALLFAITPAYAQDTSTDSDLDGFSDYWEVQGLPPMDSGMPPYPTLVPNIPDLFVFLVPASDSSPLANLLFSVDFDPFEFARKLGINIHVLDRDVYGSIISTYNRTLSSVSFQKALVIYESLNPDGDSLGFTLPGVPSSGGNITIYTNRIWKSLVKACPALGDPAVPDPDVICPECKIDSALLPVGSDGSSKEVTGGAIFPYYIKNIIAHEIGHRVRPLVYPYSTKLEYHYKAGEKTEMEQFTTSVSRKGTVTFYISSDFKDADRIYVKLVP